MYIYTCFANRYSVVTRAVFRYDRVDIDGDGSISMDAVSCTREENVGWCGWNGKQGRTTRFDSDAVAAAFIDIQQNLRGR